MMMFLSCLFAAYLSVAFGTDSPIVGILTLPCDFPAIPGYAPYRMVYCADMNESTTYLPASYVKWLESGGARVVPILADDSFENVRSLLHDLNGVLITGGSADFDSTSIWWNQLNNILDTLRQFVADHSSPSRAIPLWATCLGFEGIQCVTAGK